MFDNQIKSQVSRSNYQALGKSFSFTASLVRVRHREVVPKGRYRPVCSLDNSVPPHHRYARSARSRQPNDFLIYLVVTPPQTRSRQYPSIRPLFT